MPAVPSSPFPLVRRAAATACAGAVLLTGTGCGNQRQPPPDVRTPGPAFGSEVVRYPQAGLTLERAPAGWARTSGVAPAVAGIATGTASIGIFRFPRTEPLPKTRAELDAAATSLIAAAKARDPTFTEIKRGRLRVDGHPAVQIRGTETIAGQPRTVRTTHVYAFGAEVVVDAFAPESDFRRVDSAVFRPLLATLKLGRPAGA
ncbi:MAG: hypothetical protein JWM31_1723 [Solirubrobacterales bacterium]|nr:hypothetical protein [Solirubrobacterales bacterium]